jgi:hypothetical protein
MVMCELLCFCGLNDMLRIAMYDMHSSFATFTNLTYIKCDDERDCDFQMLNPFRAR